LRQHGISVEYSLTKAKSDKQFKRAQELNAARTVRLEHGPDGELTAKLKDLKSREERTLTIDELINEVSRK